VVEARGVVIATILAVLVLVGLLSYAAVSYSHRLSTEACHQDVPAAHCAN
jgi:Tfp pilus assembly protein PilX